jgi:cytochrome c oxidase subunit 2
VRQGTRLHADPRQGAVQADYAKWVDGKKKEMAAKADDPAKVWKLAELVARGEKVYAPTARPATGRRQGRRPDQGAGRFSAIVLDADKAAQIEILLNGAANGAMPAWKQLSDTELAAVITYTKNAGATRPASSCSRRVVAARK